MITLPDKTHPIYKIVELALVAVIAGILMSHGAVDAGVLAPNTAGKVDSTDLVGGAWLVREALGLLRS